MPLVDGQYRTLQGQPNTGIGGSSYGGVATLYALLAKPGRFGYGLIESPSLQVGMGQLVRDTSPLVALPVKVFVAFGGKEADDPVISEKLIDAFEFCSFVLQFWESLDRVDQKFSGFDVPFGCEVDSHDIEEILCPVWIGVAQ